MKSDMEQSPQQIDANLSAGVDASFLPQASRLKPHILLLLAAITIFGASLRAWHFADRPLWEDEAYTWKDCQVPYHRLLVGKHDPMHGPLSFMAVRHSMQLFGTRDPWALRLPSLIGGILCIPAA